MVDRLRTSLQMETADGLQSRNKTWLGQRFMTERSCNCNSKFGRGGGRGRVLCAGKKRRQRNDHLFQNPVLVQHGVPEEDSGSQSVLVQFLHHGPRALCTHKQRDRQAFPEGNEEGEAGNGQRTMEEPSLNRTTSYPLVRDCRKKSTPRLFLTR